MSYLKLNRRMFLGGAASALSLAAFPRFAEAADRNASNGSNSRRPLNTRRSFMPYKQCAPTRTRTTRVHGSIG